MPKKILFSSNSSRWATGFGKHARVFLKHFFSLKNPDGTRKYEVVELAQGITENDPILKANPWRTIGLVPSSQSEILEGQPRLPDGTFDQGLSQMVGYGAARIEKVLKEEKPWAFLQVEDPWGAVALRKYTSNPYLRMWDTEWWTKAHCILWTPVDSLPLYDDLVTNAHKIPHLWVKAAFGVKELHRLGHTHAKLFPLLFDSSGFRDFTDEEKLANRAKYGIKDELVMGFVFRNQGRKKPIGCLEGLKIFMENNPYADAKFLMVTNPYEPGSWDINRAVRELEIDPNRVLFPYVCHSCDEAVLTVSGTPPECDCPKCGGVKSLKHIHIHRGINEKSLVDMYNLMDGYVSQSNSGGFEAGCLESMMCSVPLAAPNYSYGETFVASGHVHSLDFVFDREINSNFKKAVISSESVADFINEIYHAPERMKLKGQRGRAWAEENLNPNIILKQIEELFDSLPDHDYDWDFCNDFPNLNAEMPDTNLDHSSFAKQLVKNFFGEELTEEDKNHEYLVSKLSAGVPHSDLFEESQKLAKSKYEKDRPIQTNPKDFLKDTGRKRLLYEMAGNFGDSLISLDVLDQLNKKYPDFDIYISSLPQFKQVYEHLNYVAGWIPFSEFRPFEFWEGSKNTEKLVDIYLSPQQNRNYIHNGLD